MSRSLLNSTEKEEPIQRWRGWWRLCWVVTGRTRSSCWWKNWGLGLETGLPCLDFQPLLPALGWG